MSIWRLLSSALRSRPSWLAMLVAFSTTLTTAQLFLVMHVKHTNMSTRLARSSRMPRMIFADGSPLLSPLSQPPVKSLHLTLTKSTSLAMSMDTKRWKSTNRRLWMNILRLRPKMLLHLWRVVRRQPRCWLSPLRDQYGHSQIHRSPLVRQEHNVAVSCKLNSSRFRLGTTWCMCFQETAFGLNRQRG